MTNTSTDVIDNGSDKDQSDDATTGLDPEDNQQTLQQLNSQQWFPLPCKRIFYGTFVTMPVSTHFPDGTIVHEE